MFFFSFLYGALKYAFNAGWWHTSYLYMYAYMYRISIGTYIAT